jgi:hypothetical protein
MLTGRTRSYSPAVALSRRRVCVRSKSSSAVLGAKKLLGLVALSILREEELLQFCGTTQRHLVLLNRIGLGMVVQLMEFVEEMPQHFAERSDILRDDPSTLVNVQLFARGGRLAAPSGCRIVIGLCLPHDAHQLVPSNHLPGREREMLENTF